MIVRSSLVSAILLIAFSSGATSARTDCRSHAKSYDAYACDADVIVLGEIAQPQPGPLLPCTDAEFMRLVPRGDVSREKLTEPLFCAQQVRFHIRVHDVLKGEADKDIVVAGRFPALFESVCDEELPMRDGLRVVVLLRHGPSGFELVEGFTGLWYTRPEDEPRYVARKGRLGREGCLPPHRPAPPESQAQVGDLLQSDSTRVSCEISSAVPRYRVGETPRLRVAIVNQSPQALYLVPLLDDSDARRRYPFVYFEVAGPTDGLAPTIHAGCGLINRLRPRDFVAVESGGAFDPFTTLDGSGRLHVYTPWMSTFKKPGQYTFTFHYVTNEPQLEKWIPPGLDDPAFRTVVDLLRQVPRTDLICSVTLTVEE